jgi:hypothetical protein
MGETGRILVMRLLEHMHNPKEILLEKKSQNYLKIPAKNVIGYA